MRVLTKAEKKEFNKTYDFLNIWVGSMAVNADRIDELRFDGVAPGYELMKFIRGFNNIFKVDELGFTFTNQSELKRINVLFNNSTKEHREIVMNRLIKYCFSNKVQPYKLRVAFKDFSIVKNETPTVYEYGRAA